MDRFIFQKNGWRQILLLLGVILLTACSGRHNAPPTPVITAQPADVSVLEGSDATFSVTATGNSPVYQWQTSNDDGANWSDISGATATSYTLATTALGDSGHLFRVLVTAAGATVASSPARLTVTNSVIAPAISVQPADQTVTEPETATFNVTASGTALQYQWQLSTDGGANWTDISGATSPSYTTPATSASESGAQFRVRISNSAGSAISTAATLTINTAPPPTGGVPVFSTQPQNITVAEGQVAHFSAVSGNATSYQWVQSSDGANWFYINGATSATYDVTASMALNGYRYYVRAINNYGSTNSATVTLTVTATPPSLPVFTTQPVDTATTEGQAATFSAAASGWPTPTFQWQVSNDGGSTWDNMNGATADTYTQPGNINTCSASGKRFRVIASNSEGTVYSNAAKLTVNPPATGWQCDLRLTDLSGTQFSVSTNASGQVAVVWSANVGNDAGLYIRRYDPVHGWGPAESVALPDSGTAGSLNTGMDNQGVVTVVWVASDIAHYGSWQHVWAGRHVSGSGWGAIAMQPLPGYAADGPGNGIPRGGIPGLAVDPSGGGATVLWIQDQLPGQSTGKKNLLAATFGAGGWGSLNVLYEQNDSNGETYVPGDLRVATGPNGHAVAVWERQSYSDTYSLWSFHFNAGLVGGGAVPITGTPYSTDFSHVGLAVDGNGKAILAWENYDSSVSRLRVRLSRYDGSWDAPQWMGNSSTDITRNPVVAFAPNGNAMVSAAAYSSSASALDYRVVAQPWTSAGGWGALEQVFDTGSNIQPGLSVVLDANGVAMIAAADGSSRLKSSRRLSGVWAAPEIGNKSSSASIMGQLILLPGGDLLAVCLGYGYNTNNLWTNSYRPAP